MNSSENVLENVASDVLSFVVGSNNSSSDKPPQTCKAEPFRAVCFLPISQIPNQSWLVLAVPIKLSGLQGTEKPRKLKRNQTVGLFPLPRLDISSLWLGLHYLGDKQGLSSHYQSQVHV